MDIGKDLINAFNEGYAQGTADMAKLQSDLRDCRNELCLKCGEYKMAHKGACDGCRWKDDG